MRKHLYFSVDEWRALPWWQQRMYVDLLNEQLAAERGEEIDPEPDEVVEDPLGLAALGFHVQSGDLDDATA